MVNTTFNADGVIFTFVSLGAAHSDRTATATVKCRKHQTSIVQNCIRKITTTSKAINEGSNYNWSVDTDIVDEFYPVGIVGIEPKYSTSLRILSFNLDGTTAWLQSECKTKRTDMTVTFHILYAPM